MQETNFTYSVMDRLHASGWAKWEDELLLSEAAEGKSNGVSLNTVFSIVAGKTGRQPNSVRNHYYLKMKQNGGLSCQSKSHFVPFTDEEVVGLVRSVLIAVSNGESVRSCTLRLGGGENNAMLRYQNKYRSVLKRNPELVNTVAEQLKREGIAVVDPYSKPKQRHKSVIGANAEVLSAINAISKLEPQQVEVLMASIKALGGAANLAAQRARTESILNAVEVLLDPVSAYLNRLKQVGAASGEYYEKIKSSMEKCISLIEDERKSEESAE